MAGNKSRSKGRRGESAAKDLLTSRDWVVADLTSGLKSEDLLATDPDGKLWSVEVKNTLDILKKHRDQAQENAKKRKANWMLISHIPNTSSWLVQRCGHEPVVWRK